ncbi:hypothetical protein EMCRGX_G014433 [Ephydatia muelleri]
MEGKALTEPRDAVDRSLYNRMSVVTHVVIVLYSTAFWIQTGALPFLSKKLGADPVTFGYLETVFAVAMLVGGPIFGRFGDLFGARAALVLALLSSFLTYAVLAMADGIFALFCSRLFGFMMHALHGSQMVMTDVTGQKERAGALGRLGVSYGVGMVVGPILGGYVSTYSGEQSAAAMAALLCLVPIAVVVLFVPRSTKTQEPKAAQNGYDGGVFDFQAIFELLRIPGVMQLIVLKTLIGVPAGVYHSMFTMVNMERFQLTPEINGKLLSFVGVLTIVMQGFGAGYIASKLQDNVILKMSLVTLTITYLLLSFTDTLLFLCLVMVPMVMAGSLINVIITSAMTKIVPSSTTGTSLGLSMATHSLIRTTSPSLGGYMYATFGYPSFGVFGALLSGGLALQMLVSRTLHV